MQKYKVMMVPILIAGIIQFSYAAEPNNAELKAFAMQRFHTDFDTQNAKSKEQISAQYLQNTKLSQKIQKGVMKDDPELKVATQLLTVELWAKRYLANTKVSEETLQNMFTKLNPVVNTQYKIQSLVLKDELTSEMLLKSLSDKKNIDKELDKFAQENGQKVFISGLVDSNKFDPSMQKLLSSRTKGEVFKFQLSNKQWQVVWVEDHRPSRSATFEESKEKLTMIAKQKILDDEIKKILGK